MEKAQRAVCPECGEGVVEGMSRREFLRTAGGAVAAVAAASAGVVGSAFPVYATPRIPDGAKAAAGTPESVVKTLYNSLNERQRAAVALPWDDARRKMVNANWEIVKPSIAETFNGEQREMVRAIFKGVTNEEWYPKFLAQMKTDGDGIENYHVAIFGDPNTGKSEWVMTGRHTTIRAGGDPAENMAFGGPIFYGHAPKFNEDPGHPGNVFWYQAKRANEVYQMLDGKQRQQALIAVAPEESAVSFRKPGEPLPGIPVSALSRDQKEHVHLVMHDILEPYRKRDVDEVLRDVKESGGLDSMHLAFYKQDDLGNDGVWDIWRLEGPAFVWHFRGAPHVHTWVHIERKA